MDIKRSACRYTAYFCEENIWLLARDLVAAGMPGESLQVVFFVNARHSVLLHRQRAAPPAVPLIWDYHVVLRANDGDADRILDLDTRLPFPCPTGTYLEATFPDQAAIPVGLRAWVRSIPADAYLHRFRSDRSHMAGELPAAEFPDYPCISPPPDVAAIDLALYRDPGQVLDDGSTVCKVDDLPGTVGLRHIVQSTR